MPDEPDIIDIRTAGIAPSSDQHCNDIPERSATPPDPDDAGIEITIERDVAVQIVGSDAGRRMRIKPHSSMTKGASPQEFTDVRAVLDPFLRDEVKRCHEDKSHRPKASTVRATPRQALALKAFCRRYGTFLQDHLDKHPGDDSRDRSKKRLDQACRVIAQVDAALGLPTEDIRSPDQLRREVIAKAEALDAALAALGARTDVADAGSAIAPLVELHDAVRRCLSLCERS